MLSGIVKNSSAKSLKTLLLLSVLFCFSLSSNADDSEPLLTLKEFIQLATKNDTTFETILLDELPLQYRRAAFLPDKDWVLSVKQELHLYLDQDHSKGDTSLSLNKLFADSGTDLSVNYVKPASTDFNDNASLQVLVSQPIAKNAFGRGYRLEDSIIGIENEIIRHQIVEAYEDYFSALTVAYYNWYAAFENLKVGKAALQSSQKLLDNIKERKRQKIALPIDVNKMKLSLVGKEENLINLEEIYKTYSNVVFKAVRASDQQTYVPSQPELMADDIQFDKAYQEFTRESRTYGMLNLLERQGTLEVKKAADDLLPSTNLLVGYELQGEEGGTRNTDDSVFAGISLSFPIGRSVSKARHEITKIEYRKTVLSNQNKYEDLQTNLKNLFLQIQRERKLMEISKRKIELANAILKDETENYSFGKVSLNDYIDAVNTADENRFSYTAHQVQLNKFIVEWLRLTDKLVDEKAVLHEPSQQ